MPRYTFNIAWKRRIPKGDALDRGTMIESATAETIEQASSRVGRNFRIAYGDALDAVTIRIKDDEPSLFSSL